MTTQDLPTTTRVGAVQAEPVWLDLDAGVEKVCMLIQEAADKGCEIVGFPEVFVPGFPHCLFAGAPDAQWVLKYQKNSIVLGSPQYNKIRQAVKRANIWAVVGFSEREGSTLYLAQSFFKPNGDVALHRRKLKPTHVERYLWADGYAEALANTVKTDVGIVIGGLNCWEHMQPLLRFHEYSQGVMIHVASWPHLAPEGPGTPNSTTGNTSGDVVVRMLAMEGGCFAMCCTAVTTAAGSEIMNLHPALGKSAAAAVYEGGGFTAIYGPEGTKLAQAKDQFSEEIVTADLDMDQIHLHKQMADCIGHYGRPDLFSLNVNVNPEQSAIVRYSDGRHKQSFAQRLNQMPLQE